MHQSQHVDAVVVQQSVLENIKNMLQQRVSMSRSHVQWLVQQQTQAMNKSSLHPWDLVMVLTCMAPKRGFELVMSTILSGQLLARVTIPCQPSCNEVCTFREPASTWWTLSLSLISIMLRLIIRVRSTITTRRRRRRWRHDRRAWTGCNSCISSNEVPQVLKLCLEVVDPERNLFIYDCITHWMTSLSVPMPHGAVAYMILPQTAAGVRAAWSAIKNALFQHVCY